MDRDEHDLVVRHPSDDLDDMLGILRRKAARGFVEQIDVRRADHVQADVQPLSLAAGKRLLVRRSNHEVAALVQAKFSKFAVDAAQSFAAGKMRRAEGRGEVQIFLDGEVFVERVVLRNVGDVFAQRFAIRVERAPVEKDISLDRLKLAGESAHQRALSTSAGAHHADHLPSLHRERDAVDSDLPVAEPADQVANFERANDVAFLFEQPLAEVAAQDLPGVDPNSVAVGKRRKVSDRHPANENRAIRL